MNTKSTFRIGIFTFIIIFYLGFSYPIASQIPFLTTSRQFGPKDLPGNGLKHFDFMYAGENKERNIYMVRKGKIVWSYTHPVPRGEISDAVMLTNGNILFAHQFGVTEINQKKEVIWNYDAPANSEIHTAMPVGKSFVVFVQNGNPAKVVVFNKKLGIIAKEFNVPVGNPNYTHGHFRHARLTKSGTIAVAHMDMGKVCEYDSNGKLLLTIKAPGVWAVEGLKNGNFLITTKTVVQEVNRKLEVVWEFPLQGIPDYVVNLPQISIRRPNGNTIINNWFNPWGKDTLDIKNLPLQAIEVSKDKKIVWALRSWIEPVNLGPSTIIVPLNETHVNEKISFGEFR